ncbi:MAG: alpha/beta hydrolase [Pseudomonadota bacterium]
MNPSFLTTARAHKLAYHHQPGNSPGVVFCHGFRSDMASTKATALAQWCALAGVAFTRFDYHGHGASEVDFRDFTIGGAMADAYDIIDHVATGPLIVIGSSMGAWVALNAALERKAAVRGLIGIASAPDFTENLMFARMTPEQRRELDDKGVLWAHSEAMDNDYPITREFIHEARQHLLLDDVIGLDMPIHLIHGQQDADVPWETSLTLARQLMSDEVTLTLIKDGDHRLNRPADLAQMTAALARMVENI